MSEEVDRSFKKLEELYTEKVYFDATKFVGEEFFVFRWKRCLARLGHIGLHMSSGYLQKALQKAQFRTNSNEELKWFQASSQDSFSCAFARG